MFQGFEPGEEKFRGQRLLTTGVLVLLAVGMIAVALKQIAAGQLFESDLPAATSGSVPVQLAIHGQNFETPLAQITANPGGQLTGAGWLKTSPKPGEPGKSIIAVRPDWPIAGLKPGDRLEIGYSNKESLVFEVTTAPAMETISLNSDKQTSLRELKLVILDSGRSGEEEEVSATLVIGN